MIIKKKQHGTTSSYNKGCRCAKCKKAKSDFRKLSPIKGHGTKWYYDKGCRCDSCVDAKMAYRKKMNPDTKKKVTTNVEEGTRVCYTCKKTKRLDEFGRNKNKRVFMGRSHECRICHNERNRTNKNNPKAKFSIYKSNAKFRKLSFNLSFKQFNSFWNKPCYYCDSEIDGIGLDRINSKNGYSIDNVYSCCSTCNYSKGKKSQDEFIDMCIKVVKKHK